MIAKDGPFSNLTRNFRQMRHSPAAWTCALILVFIELVVKWQGGPNGLPAREWYEALGLNRDGFLSGKLWQIFSYGFLHGGWGHVGFNTLCILVIGSRVEHVVGPAAVAKTLAFGILGGGIGHLLLSPGESAAPLLVGASGGCMALLLLIATLSPQSRMFPIPVSGRSLGMGILASALVLSLLNPQLELPVLSSLGKRLQEMGMHSLFVMGHACHLGGGLAGWLYGRWLLRPRVSLQRLRLEREKREADRR